MTCYLRGERVICVAHPEEVIRCVARKSAEQCDVRSCHRSNIREEGKLDVTEVGLQ